LIVGETKKKSNPKTWFKFIKESEVGEMLIGETNSTNKEVERI